MWRKAYGLGQNVVTGRGLSRGGRKGAKLLLGIAVSPEVVWGRQAGSLHESIVVLHHRFLFHWLLLL